MEGLDFSESGSRPWEGAFDSGCLPTGTAEGAAALEEDVVAAMGAGTNPRPSGLRGGDVGAFGVSPDDLDDIVAHVGEELVGEPKTNASARERAELPTKI